MHLLPLATLTGLQIGLTFGLAGMAFAALFGTLGMYFHHRRQALWHETARIALEKGQPLPALPDDVRESAAASKNPEDSDFRTGLILVAVGTGLYFFLRALVGIGLAYVGLIPGFIGVALLVYGACRTMAERKGPTDSNPPPRA